MPQQLLETGFTDCGSVRVSYSATATPTNAPPLDDAAGRYFLVDRPEPTQALKIVLEHSLGTDPYYSYECSYIGNFSEDVVRYNPIRIEAQTSSGAYSQQAYDRIYKRKALSTYSDPPSGDGTVRYSTSLDFYSEISFMDYDENGNEITVTFERIDIRASLSAFQTHIEIVDDGPAFLASTATYSGHTLRTGDGRLIDMETAIVADGWSIVVYEVYEWGDSELTRFRFDTDPQTVTAECLGDQLCDNGCIEFVIDADGAYNCICPDDDPALGLEPPIDPDIALEIPPREQLHRDRAKLRTSQDTLAKSEQAYRNTLEQIKQKEQQLNDASAQGDSGLEASIKSEIESLVETGGLQAGKYQDLKNDYANDSQALNNLTGAERESEITVVPTDEGWRYPPITPGGIAPPTPEVNIGGILEKPIRAGIQL
jgi:hypothetical protein